MFAILTGEKKMNEIHLRASYEYTHGRRRNPCICTQLEDDDAAEEDTGDDHVKCMTVSAIMY